jgi:hypothetical protein
MSNDDELQNTKDKLQNTKCELQNTKDELQNTKCERQLQYHIEEYKSLRAETARFGKEISSTEISFLLAAAAVYSWLSASYTQHHLPGLVWCIPFLLSVFGYRKWWVTKHEIKLNGEYVKSLEERYLGREETGGRGTPGPHGWEHFLDGVEPSSEKVRRKIYDHYPIIYWRVFMGVTFVVALVAPFWLKQQGNTAAAETKVVFPVKAEKVEVNVRK